jgi:hypothetical protein
VVLVVAVDMAAAADNGASADRNAEFHLIVARADARAIVLRSQQLLWFAISSRI